MVSHINDAFLKFERRAEGSDIDKLVETFVDVGPLFTLLENTDHQIVTGRRGTGKTHALMYLSQTRLAKGDISVFVDLRTIGSNTSIYTNPQLPLQERATRLLIDVFMAIHEGLYRFLVENAERLDLSRTGPLLDRLSDAIGELKVDGTVQIETQEATNASATTEVSGGITASMTDFSFKVGGTEKHTQGRQLQTKQIESGVRRYHVHFGSVQSSLATLLEGVQGVRLWVLLDEWSTVPPELQPYLADLLKHTILPIRGATVKIAAIEQRSRFKIDGPTGTYIGLELGADVPSDINLDDFMVFDNQPMRAREFFSRLLYNHFKAIEQDVSLGSIRGADALISAGFTQVNVFDQLVRAAEGVPRDAMNIISLAATRALDDRISMRQIQEAARDWYQRGKERTLTSNAQCMALLHYIIDEVIGKKNARAFLLRSNVKSALMEELFDARVLHILKRNVSGKDLPGVRYDVYKLDYGCYVELLNTAREPQLLLAVDPDENSQVPLDDYRSIRRAILDLDAFFAGQSKQTSLLL